MEAVRIGRDRVPFWDDYAVDTAQSSAFQRVIPPVKKECCFTFDRPNETFSISYPCIVKDPGGYKMYYQPWYEDGKGPCVCVNESSDGINWHRPQLDIYPGQGLKQNNIVIDRVKDGIFVFYDTNPLCPEQEKYKAVGPALMLHPDGESKTSLCCYTSPDGYHFTLSHPMTRYGAFDSLNTALWNGESYVCYLRSFHNIPGVDNKEVLPVARSASQEVKKSLLEYIRRNGR